MLKGLLDLKIVVKGFHFLELVWKVRRSNKIVVEDLSLVINHKCPKYP